MRDCYHPMMHECAIHVVSTVEECDKLIRALLDAEPDVYCLGFDSEW